MKRIISVICMLSMLISGVAASDLIISATSEAASVAADYNLVSMDVEADDKSVDIIIHKEKNEGPRMANVDQKVSYFFSDEENKNEFLQYLKSDGTRRAIESQALSATNLTVGGATGKDGSYSVSAYSYVYYYTYASGNYWNCHVDHYECGYTILDSSVTVTGSSLKFYMDDYGHNYGQYRTANTGTARSNTVYPLATWKDPGTPAWVGGIYTLHLTHGSSYDFTVSGLTLVS